MRNTTYLCFILCMLLFDTVRAGSNAVPTEEAFNEIQRVRISFTMPTGHTRHLLLAFTPDNNATDGVDYGYDASNVDNFPNDLNWIIDEGRYVIQAVGAFNDNKFFELGMFLVDAGDIAINLTALENFDEAIDVYVYDALLNNYTSINESSYTNVMDAGEYRNRFYLSFTNAMPANIPPGALSIDELFTANTTIGYQKTSNSIQIDTNQNNTIQHVDVYNLLGQHLITKVINNQKSTQISLHGIKASSLLIVRVKSNQKTFTRKLLIH